ncbi:MAG: hypothetical protein ABIZ91_03215 [Gemmatimonadaceae bacterium]
MSHAPLTTTRLPLLLLLLSPLSLAAQERLISRHALAGGASFETLTFGSGGITQYAFAGTDSVRVMSVRQVTIPITAITPLGAGWRLDVTTLYANGRVDYEDGDAAGVEHSASLSGLSDVRLRATGRVLNDALTLTVGVNAPTGRTTLRPGEFSALRVLAAPALGMGSSPVGAGASGTVGAVYGRQIGLWAMAFGASYEHRGRFQPVAALVAGAPSSDFEPGAVVRASVGADRTLGAHRLSVAASADVFAEDRLRPSADTAGGSNESRSSATVRLGPVLAGDAQLFLASSRFRELIVYTSYLWRSAFARDGRTETGSSGQYLAGGVRAALPLSARSDLVFATDGRWHSGLGVDQGLPTAGVRAANVSVGLDARRGLLSVQPYLRAQAGTLRQRGSETPVTNKSFAGIAGGLVLVTRF